MKSLLLRICSLLIIAVAAPTGVQAQSLISQIGGTPITGNTTLSNDAVTVSGTTDGNDVILSISAKDLSTDSAKIKEVWLNFFQTGVSVDDLTLSQIDGPSIKSVKVGPDDVTGNPIADDFDIEINYKTANNDKFTGGEVSRLRVSADDDIALLVSSFSPGTPSQPSVSAGMHVLSLANGSSAKYASVRETQAVPEPTPFLASSLLLLTFLAFTALRTLKRARPGDLNSVAASSFGERN